MLIPCALALGVVPVLPACPACPALASEHYCAHLSICASFLLIPHPARLTAQCRINSRAHSGSTNVHPRKLQRARSDSTHDLRYDCPMKGRSCRCVQPSNDLRPTCVQASVRQVSKMQADDTTALDPSCLRPLRALLLCAPRILTRALALTTQTPSPHPYSHTHTTARPSTPVTPIAPQPPAPTRQHLLKAPAHGPVSSASSVLS